MRFLLCPSTAFSISSFMLLSASSGFKISRLIRAFSLRRCFRMECGKLNFVTSSFYHGTPLKSTYLHALSGNDFLYLRRFSGSLTSFSHDIGKFPRNIFRGKPVGLVISQMLRGVQAVRTPGRYAFFVKIRTRRAQQPVFCGKRLYKLCVVFGVRRVKNLYSVNPPRNQILEEIFQRLVIGGLCAFVARFSRLKMNRRVGPDRHSPGFVNKPNRVTGGDVSTMDIVGAFVKKISLDEIVNRKNGS